MGWILKQWQRFHERMTSQQQDDKLGKTAYDAYMMQLGDMGDPWDGLSGTEQNAWIAAARTVEATVREREPDVYR